MTYSDIIVSLINQIATVSPRGKLVLMCWRPSPSKQIEAITQSLLNWGNDGDEVR
ncbi:hypothetical protein J6590_049297 [Homalodisca vitripennis]|nr:hypothetical protein J6590_049297 [Homalodisca vitripennis]